MVTGKRVCFLSGPSIPRLASLRANAVCSVRVELRKLIETFFFSLLERKHFPPPRVEEPRVANGRHADLEPLNY